MQAPEDRVIDGWTRFANDLVRDPVAHVAQLVELMTSFEVATKDAGLLSLMCIEDAIEVASRAAGMSEEAVIKIWKQKMGSSLRAPESQNLPENLELAQSLRAFADVESVEFIGLRLPYPKRRTIAPSNRPPWAVFQEGPLSLRWRMGPGEDYRDNWLHFWRSLSAPERANYLAANPAPEDWSQWLKRIAT